MFLAPAMLLGLLAIGAPLWLHRVARADPTQHPFASHMFLEASETQRNAKHTLRYWLLLALRILLLAALAFAFAGPLATQRLLPQASAPARLHAIVLDASFSMQHGDRWMRALQAAEGVLDDIDRADRVTLVRAAGRSIEVIHEPVVAANAGSLRAALRDLEPGLERLDFGLAMSTANSWLGSPRPPTVLHLISDLQQSGAPLRFADLEPPAGVRLVLHSVSDENQGNAYLDGAVLASRDERTLQTTVRHSAAQPQAREVILRIDGQEFARQRVELAAGAPVVPAPGFTGESEGGASLGSAGSIARNAQTRSLASTRVSFPGVELTPGAHRIELALTPNDALPQDDQFFAVVENADPRAALISRSETADDAAYFAAALGSLASPRLKLEQRVANTLSGESLAGYSLVVIADASGLSSAVSRRVLEYVAAGGAVLAAVGNDAQETLPLLEDWRIGEGRTQATRVGEIATTHPVLREAGDWRRVRFFKQRSVVPGENDAVLIAYEGGAPLLVEREWGAGRMLVLTAPIERSWNDLAIHPLFVHFIAEAGRYLAGADATPVSHTAGALVMTGLTPAAGGQIFDPQGERVLSLAEARTADRLVPRLTGFYEVRGGAKARWLAVNVDARESDLTPLAPAYLQRWQALRIRDALADQRASERRADAAPYDQQAATPSDGATLEVRSLGPLLMWIAAALLLAELLLANRYLAIRRE